MKNHITPPLVSALDGLQLTQAMPEDALIVRGAREHNLKNIDVTIPRDRLTSISPLVTPITSEFKFESNLTGLT